jgi:hypothetical protein
MVWWILSDQHPFPYCTYIMCHCFENFVITYLCFIPPINSMLGLTSYYIFMPPCSRCCDTEIDVVGCNQEIVSWCQLVNFWWKLERLSHEKDRTKMQIGLVDS